MSIKDIIKNGVYDILIQNKDQIGVQTITITMLVAVLIAIYLFFAYRLMSKKYLYNKELNITISGVVIIVCSIMLAMQASLLVSFGMVGALSIVRFRTAIKNPLDLLFLFWGISSGIICGVGLYAFALGLCLLMTVFIMLTEMYNGASNQWTLFVKCSKELQDNQIESIIKKHTLKYKCSSVCIRGTDKEMVFDIPVNKYEEILAELSQMAEISYANIVERPNLYR